MEISKRGKDSGQASKHGSTEGRVGYSSFSSKGERIEE